MEHSRHGLMLSGIFVVLYFILIKFIYFCGFFNKSELGQMGDFVGGSIGPLLSFLAIFFVIKHNSEQSENELEKVKHDIFLRQLDIFITKFEEITYSGRTRGLNALEDFNDPFESRRFVKEMGENLYPIFNSLNNLFLQSFIDLKATDTLNSSGKKLYAATRYEILTLSVPESYVLALVSAKTSILEDDKNFKDYFDDSAISCLKSHFKLNNNRYPRLLNKSSMRAIYAGIGLVRTL